MKILSNILVSIIINNYNYADYLSDAIESVLSQKYGNVELIIVDDGSTDSSRLIMDKYKEKAILCYKENGGQASAFNLGFKHAKGELVQFLDADDYLYPNAIERIVQVYEKNKDQKIGGRLYNEVEQLIKK